MKDNNLGKKAIHHYYLTAADVQSLYPNVPRTLICIALNDALDTCSSFTKEERQIFIDLSMFCLDNSLISFNGQLYKQKKGIVTGENNSVTLANIALHFIIKEIDEINTIEIFRRYIDDIIYICKSKEKQDLIKNKLDDTFAKYEMQLTYKHISTEENNQSLEFLDVQHCTDSDTSSIYITDYIKPTAKGRMFVNGKSFHSPSVFKAIITGKAKRLRRLNTHDDDYQNSIQRLEEKCVKSNFNKTITKEKINLVKKWNNNNNINNVKPNKTEERLTWVTQFKNLLKFDQLERKLVPKAQITYCRPPTLGSKLFNFKRISSNVSGKSEIKSMSKCHKCGLCGNRGQLKNMVLETNTIKTIKDKNINVKRKKNLTCKNYGIYAGVCNICDRLYVGQTKNSFSTRWNAHRTTWRKYCTRLHNDDNITTSQSDEQALFIHYMAHHREQLTITSDQMLLSDAYSVIFLEEPQMKNLDLRENFWISKLEASINIAKTFLPKVK